jgi:hypothetical protein
MTKGREKRRRRRRRISRRRRRRRRRRRKTSQLADTESVMISKGPTKYRYRPHLPWRLIRF